MLEPFQLPFVQHGIVEVLILAVAGIASVELLKFIEMKLAPWRFDEGSE